MSKWYASAKYLGNRKSARAWRTGREAKRRYYADRHFARMARRFK